jgi:hypothetical protein
LESEYRFRRHRLDAWSALLRRSEQGHRKRINRLKAQRYNRKTSDIKYFSRLAQHPEKLEHELWVVKRSLKAIPKHYDAALTQLMMGLAAIVGILLLSIAILLQARILGNSASVGAVVADILLPISGIGFGIAGSLWVLEWARSTHAYRKIRKDNLKRTEACLIALREALRVCE